MATPLYEADGIRIYHGDCRAFLPEIGLVDHTITDPPYDQRTHAGARSANTKGGTVRGISTRIPIDFDPLDVTQMVPVLLGLTRRWVVACCSLEMLGLYREVAGEAYVRGGIWRRPDGAPQFTGDRPGQPGDGLAILHQPGRAKRWNGGGAHAYYEHLTVKHGRVHPTQKPEGLMLELIAQFTDPGELILDPFMGSGTTLVAAKRLGRRAIGMEIDREWAQRAVERLAQTTLALFDTRATQGALDLDAVENP